MRKSSGLIKLLLLSTMAVFVLSMAVSADTVITQTQKMDAWEMMGQKMPAKIDTIVTMLSGKKVRVNRADTVSTILDMEKNMMYVINHGSKTYTELSLSAFSDMSEKMMKIVGTVTASEETKKIKNWNCRKYTVDINMGIVNMTQEMWASEDIKVDHELFIQASNAMMSQFEGFGDFLKEMRKIKGVSVHTEMNVDMMGNKMHGSTDIISVEEKKTPAGTYDIPKGYTKVEMKIPGMGR